MFAAICIAVFVLLMAIVYLGAKSGKLQHFFKVHPWIPKILVLGYIVFAGCFMFPIRSEPFPLDFQGVYLLAASHGVIALAFAGIWGAGQGTDGLHSDICAHFNRNGLPVSAGVWRGIKYI